MKSKILKATGIFLFILASLVWATPWLIKGKVGHILKSQINKNLRAHTSFSGLDISLFRQFPKISIGLDHVLVTCVGEFQGDTLMTARQIDLACDLTSLFSGDSVRVHSMIIHEPRLQAHIHGDGHANWNIFQRENLLAENIDSTSGNLNWQVQHYVIHDGFLDYLDEKRNIHVIVRNLEHSGLGNLGAAEFSLHTKTTAEAIQFNYGGGIPFNLLAKANILVTFHVDRKTGTWSFNTDQLVFNDMKLHTEGFFQWISDSSYNMNIKYKLPSTQFKNFLSMLPSIYQKDFASVETNGQVNFNGFIKGRYAEGHFPAYHTNLYIMNGYFKYPDLPTGVENINLGFQVDNPDGMADHMTIHVTNAHVEMNGDTVDLQLLAKNLKSKPYLDMNLSGRLDLAGISKWMKPASGTRLGGLLTANLHARGYVPGAEKQKKESFSSGGYFDVSNFTYTSDDFKGGVVLNDLTLDFTSKNIIVSELKGEYLNTHFEANGTVNNFFDYAMTDNPLSATMNLKADEFNLREWVGAGRSFKVPGNMHLTLNSEAGKVHYDNLDLQNMTGKFVVADQAVQFQNVKASGLDGEVAMEGTYSTLEGRENPEISFVYDAKGIDIQKAFFAFNTARKILPVAKFMSGNINAHMSLDGRLNDDMTTSLATLQGAGTIELLTGSMKDFGPLDKLSQSLDITGMKDIPLKDVKTEFTFKAGKVVVNPFLVHANELDMLVGGSHGFDQSLDYDVTLKLPRSQLGSKGTSFVKNVVETAAGKGIPVKLADAVTMNVKMCGTINSPDVNADMNRVVSNAESDLNREVNDFVNAKLDSARQQLQNPPASKKPLYVQANYKTKSVVKSKKKSSTAHKKKTHTKTAKKKKKTTRHYTASLKKETSTASTGRKHTER